MRSIPDELLLLIFDALDIKTLVTCRLVARSFRTLIDSAASVCYRIELAIHGMADSPFKVSSSHLPSQHARLRALLDQRRAWLTLSPRKSYRIPIHRADTVYELNCGAFALMDGPDSRSHVLDWVELPSIISGRNTQKTTALNSGIVIGDFTLDLEQDLFVAIESAPAAGSNDTYSIHIRSATTGQPHPLAAQPLITVTRDSDVDNDCYYNLGTYGSVVGMVFCSDTPDTTDQLFLYDWRTGEFLLSMSKTEMEPEINSFTLLSERTFMIPNPAPGTLDIFTIEPRIIHRSHDPQRWTHLVRKIASLHLPELLPSWTYTVIRARTQPTPGPAGTSSTPTPSNSSNAHVPEPTPHYLRHSTPFMSSAEQSGIIALSIAIQWLPPEDPLTPDAILAEALAHPGTHTLFVPWNLLLGYANEALELSRSKLAGHEVKARFNESDTRPIPADPEENGEHRPQGEIGPIPISPPIDPSNISFPAVPFYSSFRPLLSWLPHKPLNIPWSEWGPRSTRWFTDVKVSRAVRDIYGSRAVMLDRPPRTTEDGAGTSAPPPDAALRLLDFNIWPYLRERTLGGLSTPSLSRTAATDQIPPLPSSSSSPPVSIQSWGWSASLSKPPPPGPGVLATSEEYAAFYRAQCEMEVAEKETVLKTCPTKCGHAVHDLEKVITDFPTAADWGGEASSTADCSSAGMRSNIDASDTPTCTRKLYLGRSVVPAKAIFKEDIISELPFVEMVSTQRWRFDGVMMDDECILGLEENDQGNLVTLTAFVM